MLVPPALGLLFASACNRPPSSCNDTSGLSEDDVNLRKTMGYVDQTPSPDKRCSSCRHYVIPPSQTSCGTCKILKGPVHPNGYCQGYAPL